MSDYIQFNTDGMLGNIPISFYEIMSFAGAGKGHIQWIESSISNGLSFKEIDDMLESLWNNTDDKAVHNVQQIQQCFDILKIFSIRFRVCLSRNTDVVKFDDQGWIPKGTPMINGYKGILFYCEEDKRINSSPYRPSDPRVGMEWQEIRERRILKQVKETHHIKQDENGSWHEVDDVKSTNHYEDDTIDDFIGDKKEEEQ